MKSKKDILSSIPSVDELLKNVEIEKLLFVYSRKIVVDGIREYLNGFRKYIVALDEKKFDGMIYDENILIEGIIEQVSDSMRNNLIHVVNATGVVLHTNLGRALLSPKIKDSLWEVASHFSNLEMNVAEGARGSRYDHVEKLICKLTGAESAMVVNNNAAAVMLVLSTMAKTKEVIVSRGQLVEIGGSFRVPEVMEQSGAYLKEVGSTNKTHLMDYEKAVNENTGALMKVHTSNYRICGFTKEIESEDLVALGKKLGIPVIEDLGSGVLLDLTPYGLPYEPTVQSAVASGMDIVTFSGDKMLGGPQAGIIVGKKEYIEKMKKNPLTRAFRIDKLTLSALEGTLKLYIDGEVAMKEIPLLRMLTFDMEELSRKARRLSARLKKSLGDKLSISIQNEYSEVGGGSMPLHKMPTKVVAITSSKASIDAMDNILRKYEVPIISRISKEKLLLDVRTIADDEYIIIEKAFRWAFDYIEINKEKARVKA